MRQPGEQRPLTTGTTPSWGKRPGRPRHGSRSPAAAVLLALATALASAAAWAVARAILELGPGALVVAGMGGWGIGAAFRGTGRRAVLAGLLGVGAWVAALVLTWLLALAVLPGSSRTFAERIASTPVGDWLAPQFGLLEVAGLLLFAGAAVYASRPSSSAAGP